MSATLVIMAAGMASRYGSLKQIDKFGPSGESIIDYSIFDAIEAGFTKIVFIIRREFAAEFEAIFNPRFGDKICIEYAYQDMESFTDGFPIPAERSKPWGTAHAVLCASTVVNEPFAVINADDFYGKDAFDKAYRFLATQAASDVWANICYELTNTLSEHGSVSRGICQTDTNDNIVSIVERVNVFKQNNQIVFEESGKTETLEANTKASMNFWCFPPEVFVFAKQLFQTFLQAHGHEPKSEFFITLVCDEFIKQGKGVVKAITTPSQWFGVTYKEDKPIVQNTINNLISGKTYPMALWGVVGI